MLTAKDLEELVKTKLKDYKFILASNREPYIHKYDGDEIRCIRPASGLVSALEPVMRACHGTWIAHGSGDADQDVADENGRIRIPPDKPKYILRRMWLTKEEENGYYYGFSNQTLWPLCHIVHVGSEFNETYWKTYKSVNEKFAQAVLDEIEEEKAIVWLQDYHLALAAKFIKKERPDVYVAQFWHIPWPNPEAFRICPWKEEILAGMLSNDLLGFHIKYHCDNFLEAVEQMMEAKVSREMSEVTAAGHTTKISPFPISVDFEGISEKAKSPEVIEASKKIRKLMHAPYEFLLVSLDRTDYTKGIIERMKAIDRFLEKYPEYQKRLVYVSICAPSRIHIRRYKDLADDISSIVEDINWKYRYGNWFPIVLKEEHVDYETILSYYRSADLCIVSSLHDGMNIVAKEFVAAQADNKGMLVLSQFTGSARELGDAVLVNPYDTEKFSDAIKFALELPAKEKKRRMERLKEIVKENNIYSWAAKFTTELSRLDKGKHATP